MTNPDGSRREFFQKFLGRKREKRPEKLNLGRLSRFPAGQRILQADVEVTAWPEGLQAKVEQVEGVKYLGLSIDSHGFLWADPSQGWNESDVLCLMTGEKRKR